MKSLSLLMILSLTVLAFSGCPDAANTTTVNNQTPASSNATPAKTATPAASPTAKAEVPASNLKPADASPDKPVAAVELKNAFFADQAAWKGKQVAITGNYHSHTTSTVSSGKVVRIDIADQTGKKVAACTVADAPSADDVKERNNRTFKGTVKEAWFDQVLLEPCEMMK